MPERTEFGFHRTNCGCRLCAINCEFIPGFLIPSDIPRLMEHFGFTDEKEFARQHLRASPGSLVMRDGVIFRIPCLVPRRQRNVSCQWLTPDKKCAVHEVSPYGCAFLDVHMSKEEQDARAQVALLQLEREFDNYAKLRGSTYAVLWHYLNNMGLTNIDPRIMRKRMNQQLKDEGLWDDEAGTTILIPKKEIR